LFAVAHATYAREQDPNAAWSLNMRAHAHLRNDELDLALEAALQSVSTAQESGNGDLAEFLLTAASAQLKRGDLAECDKLINAASANDRSICKRLQAEISTVSGLLALQRGNIDKAIAKLQVAVALAEKVAVATTERDARTALETAYRTAGRATEADSCKRALRRLADRQAQIKAQQRHDTRSVPHRVSELVVQWNNMPTA
jgi:tetratricopeptide (TPR) repeat protein